MDKLVLDLIEDRKQNMGEHSYVINVLKIDRGRLFKGHSGQMVYGVFENKQQFLQMSNNYFDGHTLFHYNFETDMTRLEVVITSNTPKYMQEFYNTITINNKLDMAVVEPETITSNHTALYLNEGFIELRFTLHFKGFMPLSHYENIKVVDQARNRMRRFKAIIREKGSDKKFCSAVSRVINGHVFLAESLYD